MAHIFFIFVVVDALCVSREGVKVDVQIKLQNSVVCIAFACNNKRQTNFNNYSVVIFNL